MSSRTSDNSSTPQVPASQQASFLWILFTNTVAWVFGGRFTESGPQSIDKDLFIEAVIMAGFAALGGLIAQWGYFRVFSRSGSMLDKLGLSKMLLKFGVKESILTKVAIASLVVGILFSGASAATLFFYPKYQHEGSLLIVLILTATCYMVYYRRKFPSERKTKSKSTSRVLSRSKQGRFVAATA